MGKFILGILAIILLQVIFFGYTSRYWSIPSEPGLVKSRPTIPEVRQPLEITKADQAPERLDETPPPAPPTKKRIDGPTVASDSKVRVGSQPESVRRPVVLPSREPSDRNVASKQTRSYETRFSRVIPKGHTMMLVDNLAPTAGSSRSVIASAPKSIRSTTATVEDSEPRRRSLLAKSFSVAVKKPWGWMKSLASKLD